VFAFCFIFAFVIACPVSIAKLLWFVMTITGIFGQTDYRLLSAQLHVPRRVPAAKTRSFTIYVIGSCGDELERETLNTPRHLPARRSLSLRSSSSSLALLSHSCRALRMRGSVS
jgi:hypothetical protein